MKQIQSILVTFLLAVVLSGPAFSAAYDIDASHSSVMFKVKHLAISTVTGRFDKFSGTFHYDPKDTGAWKVEAKIEAASINTGIDKRDDHLRSADFFAVDTHAELAFVSKEVMDIQDDRFKVSGDLTLHGVTKSVVLNVEVGGTVKDPWGNERAAFTAETKINRKDFGLTWSKALETGGLVVGEDVKIILEIEGIQKKEEK